MVCCRCADGIAWPSKTGAENVVVKMNSETLPAASKKSWWLSLDVLAGWCITAKEDGEHLRRWSLDNHVGHCL